MKPLYVLSIDFDVFQTFPNIDTLNAMPDGIDLSPRLSDIVWATRYAYTDPTCKLEQIKFDQKNASHVLQEMQKHIAPDTNAMITNSHVHIYDFIMKHFNTQKHTGILLDHLDMHHDMFNENPELDCGNWIGHLKKQTKLIINWYPNQISPKAYGLDDDDAIMKHIHTEPYHAVSSYYDCIFICRSDPWFAPHLDHYFHDYFQIYKHILPNLRAEQRIMEPRDLTTDIELMKTSQHNFNRKELTS